MGFNHFRLFAKAALLVAGSMTALANTPNVLPDSGIFEVDLLFPRNETYTPQALMPIVWALQNPFLGVPAQATIFWALWEGNNFTGPGSISQGLLELTVGTDLSITEPALFNRIVNTISYPEGTWTLSWEISVSNCTPSANPQPITLSNTVIFNTSSSGQTPDLVAATSPDKCGKAEGFAFNVMSSNSSLCAGIGPTPTTTTNPCGATINPSAASSIAADATAMACQPFPGQSKLPNVPNVTCPTFGSTSSADAAGRTRIVAASTLLVLLATLTTLIRIA